MKSVTKGVKLRVREVDLRPKKLDELKDILNVTEHFLQATRAVLLKTGKDDEKPFTDSEVKYLEKLVKDTYVSTKIDDCLIRIESDW